MEYKEKYQMWLDYEGLDADLREELLSIKDDEAAIRERFFADLEFGTAGLRGIVGAGTGRVNVYTIRRATAGLAKYISNHNKNDSGAVIAYDCRHGSKEFAAEAARVLAAEGIRTYLFEDLRPTPELSFVIRHLGCAAGIVVTASHNPPEYNGYKAYGADGGQVTFDVADEIIENIENIHIFNDVRAMDMDKAVNAGLITYIGQEVDEAYYKTVIAQSINPEVIAEAADGMGVVYTPFHGTGNIPVREILRRMGSEIVVVPEQELPDGDFPTVESPNPENKEGFWMAMELADKMGINLIMGTDPDADRIGVLTRRGKDEEFTALTGNQTGVLLTEYMLSQKKAKGSLPENPVVIKTIVSTEMVRDITDFYGVRLIDVLTGFKYFAEKIYEFEKTGEANYVFGFEESYGYLPGVYVRDKDAVAAAMLIVEMASWYHLRGMTLHDALGELYEKYGEYGEWVENIYLRGVDGIQKISRIMDGLRDNIPKQIGGSKVVAYSDCEKGERIDLVNNTKSPLDLPQSNVLRFETEDGSFIAFRPSGTEPKFKIYAGFKCADNAAKQRAIEADVTKLLK